MLPISMAGWGGEVAPGAAVVELHYPAGRPLNASLQHRREGEWAARVVLCRTLTLGTPNKWQGGGMPSVHIIRHFDGCGFMLAGVNTHPETPFWVAHTVRDTEGGCMLRARGRGDRLEDVIPTLSAQLLQVVSPRPGQGGWGYSTQVEVQSPPRPGSASSPGGGGGTLFSPVQLRA